MEQHMNNVVNFNSKLAKEARLEAACEWVTFLDKGLSHSQYEELRTWLEEDPLNKSELFEVASLWDKLDELNRLSELFPNTTKQNTSYKKYLYAAASLVIVSFVSFYITFFMSNEVVKSTQLVNLNTSFQTGIGQSQTFALADGSELTLNTNSIANINFTKSRRVIDLQQGEIHINVAHDKSRPLDVIVDNNRFQAVGTAFSVQRKKNEIELIVTDGKVKLEKINTAAEPSLSAKSQIVSKGEATDVALKGEAPVLVKKINNEDLIAKLSWRKGKLIFRGEPIEQVMAEIERYTSMSIRLEEDDKLKSVRVAGVFKTGDVAGLLSALNENFGINYKSLDDGAILLSLPRS